MIVIVTGSNGFVGRNLMAYLERAGHHPIGIDIDAADITDLWSMNEALRCHGPATAMVHLAYIPGVAESVANPRANLEVNVRGTVNMLEYARRRGMDRFVFLSSAAASDPHSPYGASKAAGEAYCRAYYHSYGLQTTILRATNLYGPESAEKTSIVGTFIKAAMTGDPITLVGDGTQTRDFLHVDDLCQAIMLALSPPHTAAKVGPLDVGSGVSHPIWRVADMVSGIHQECTHEDAVEIEHSPPRPGEIPNPDADINPTRLILGYAPRYQLEDGLRATYGWFDKGWHPDV